MSSTYQGNHWYRHTKYLFIHWSKIMASNKIDERVNCCSGHSHSKTQQTAFHTGYRVTELMQKHQKHRKKKSLSPAKQKEFKGSFVGLCLTLTFTLCPSQEAGWRAVRKLWWLRACSSTSGHENMASGQVSLKASNLYPHCKNHFVRNKLQSVKKNLA